MRLIASIRSRVRRDEGQALAEYGLILGLVVLVAVAVLGTLGTVIAGSAGFGLFS